MEASLLSRRRVLATALRWCTPTPGKFVVLLLLSVAILYLSDQYDWVAFNKQKGWTVLVAVATVVVSMLCLIVWFAGACLLGRRVQFGLAPLLLMIAVVALPCAWLTHGIRQARDQAEEIVTINHTYFWGRSSNHPTFDRLVAIFGQHFFCDVECVMLANCDRIEHARSLRGIREVVVVNQSSARRFDDRDIEILSRFPRLESIVTTDSRISDAGLRRLVDFPQLRYVDIRSRSITDQGIEQFAQSMYDRCHHLEVERQWTSLDPLEIVGKLKFGSTLVVKKRKLAPLLNPTPVASKSGTP